MSATKFGSSKMLMLVLALATLALAGAGMALYVLMGARSSEAATAAAPEAPPPPIFVRIEPFTVNLPEDNYGPRLLYTGLSLKVADERSRQALVEHMPQVRSRLLMLFPGRKAAELTAPGGKEALLAEMRAVLQAPFSSVHAAPAIEDVLFTEFIVQ
ncbi:flagellar basal body-associated protein FliL [Thauera aromatica]|uniref:Flagellar protein FliL n=1 Tax=Thauera aromatica K172 TaxID=44139 RepID=A0A2R4BIZ3_THAAR|nr:flagellar basal body-associated protein FliL [Thauera aromatica]AVR87297.1 Flagellar biosynthesis protein FliL [Thauera aromatica K172]